MDSVGVRDMRRGVAALVGWGRGVISRRAVLMHSSSLAGRETALHRNPCPSRFTHRLVRSRLVSFVFRSRDSHVVRGVARERYCSVVCVGECMCDARTVIEAWWITLIRSPCIKARAGNTAVAGTAGSTRTLRNNSGAHGTEHRREANGPRTRIIFLKENRVSGK